MRFIYKIVCDDLPEFIYIGSTCNMIKRKSQHKSRSKDKNLKLYTTIRENGGWDNWRMVLVEELGDVSKNEALIREEHYRVEFQANLNMKKCYITEEQRKEEKKEYDKIYNEDNKQRKQHNKEYSKKYREDNNEEVKEYYKKYREDNKEQIKIYHKKYREKKKLENS